MQGAVWPSLTCQNPFSVKNWIELQHQDCTQQLKNEDTETSDDEKIHGPLHPLSWPDDFCAFQMVSTGCGAAHQMQFGYSHGVLHC